LTGNFPKEIVLLSFNGPFANGSGKLERLDLTGNEWLSNYNNGNQDSSWMTDLGSIGKFFIKIFCSRINVSFPPSSSSSSSFSECELQLTYPQISYCFPEPYLFQKRSM